jgi:hypothetical protein
MVWMLELMSYRVVQKHGLGTKRRTYLPPLPRGQSDAAATTQEQHHRPVSTPGRSLVRLHDSHHDRPLLGWQYLPVRSVRHRRAARRRHRRRLRQGRHLRH